MPIPRHALPPNIGAFVDAVVALAKSQWLHGRVTVDWTGGAEPAFFVKVTIPADLEGKQKPDSGG